MPGVGLRYSATYESPYREDANQEQSASGDEKAKPVVTIRGYEDRDSDSGAISRPQVVDYRLAGDEYDSAGGQAGAFSSSSSEGVGSPPSPPTPLIKTLASPATKPLPVDPLHFVKAPLPTLCKQAVEQIQLATENKITKEKVKEEEEEWQANLDKWKSARRQRVPERLLSRAEEAKRLLEEEEARQIRKVKTFSEMMQQRQSRQQSGSHLAYNLNFFGQDHEAGQGEQHCVHFDEENKENGLATHKRLTTADSVDSQSEGKSSDGVSDERLGSEGSHGGSEERLVSPLDQWTADSGLDSLSGSAVAVVTPVDRGHSRTEESPTVVSVSEVPPQDSLTSSAASQLRLPLTPAGSAPSKECMSNPNEVIIRLFINPSSDIFGFTLTQNSHKVIVESVDEDGVADLAGLKQGDEVISLNGVLADSPGSVPSSMDLALMTGQLEMVIYRADARDEQSAEEAERRTNFRARLARFSSADIAGQNGTDPEQDRGATTNEVIIEPKLVERRKSQLFIQALQMEQDEEGSGPEQSLRKDQNRPTVIDVPVEEQLIVKRKNSLSKSLAETADRVEKKSPVEVIAPQTIEKKKAEFIRQASCENIVRSIDVASDIVVEQHLVLQRKASIEQASHRSDETKAEVDLPSVAVAQLKASIENSGALTGTEGSSNKAKPVDIETTLEERKASFFEHSGSRIERTTVDLNIEPKLIEQRKANLLENAETPAQKTGRDLVLDIQPKLIEQRKANFLENAAKNERPPGPQECVDIEARTVERKLFALQIGCDAAPPFTSDHRKVELTLNSMQSKPKIEVAIEPDLIRKRKEALFCSSSTTNEIERRRAKLANIEAEVYGTLVQQEDPRQKAQLAAPKPAGDPARQDCVVQAASSSTTRRSPTDRSESTVSSEDSRSCVTTVTEIKREVDTATLTSSAASSSMFSSISERNESPAHLSDLSPDSESGPVVMSADPASTELPTSEAAPFAGNPPVYGERPAESPSTTSFRVNDPPHSELSQPLVSERTAAHSTAEVVSSPLTAVQRTKDAGHTPWNREKELRVGFVVQSTTESFDGEDPNVTPTRHQPEFTTYLSGPSADSGNDSATVFPVNKAVDADSDRQRKLRQVALQPQPPQQRPFRVEAEVRVKQISGQELYGNNELLASGSGEQLYQVPGNGDFDLYDQLPSQPPKGVKKGPAPAPPSHVTPYDPAEEIYENGSQFNRRQHMYHGPYRQQLSIGRPAGAVPVSTVHLASAVSTNQASLHGSQARFGPVDPDDQGYGEVRRAAGHEAAPAFGEVARRREAPVARQERKSYHEGAVNYPAYEFVPPPQTIGQESASGYPCSEDIYENTRKYAKSCEDLYANSNQIGKAPATTSILLPGKTGELPVAGGASGYGQEIYENVETYAKTRDYLNNLRKPSVAEDFYEAPRISHEQGRVLSASVNKPSLEVLQRSRSQPFMGGMAPAGIDSKLIPQRKSADSLRDEPRQSTADLGTKKKPQQSTKTFNANHWLIQEAEMRRHLEAQNLAYASQTAQFQGGYAATAQANTHANPSVTAVTTSVGQSTQLAKRTADRNPGQLPQEDPQNATVCPPTVMPALSGPQRKAQGPPTDSASPTELGISGKKRCSLCSQELGRGAAMVIESLQLHFHLGCFRCCVCRQRLGNGTCGTDVRVRNSKLHCHNCNSYDEAGLKYSRV